MQEEPNLTNILSIAGAGLLIFLTGLSFLFFREFISRNIRFFLPLPPIAVAAYIYVINLYQQKNGLLTDTFVDITKEVIISVGFASFSFATFVGLLILFINTFRKLL